MAVRADRPLGGRRRDRRRSPRTLLGAGEDPFARLEDLPEARGDAEVGGGWFGWLGYGLGARVERLPPRPPRPVPLPDAHLAFYDHVLRQDAAGVWWFESLGDDAPLERLQRAARAAAAAPAPPVPAEFALRAPGAGGHVAAVRDCVERIAAGEIFQANLCLRLEAAWHGYVADLFATPRRACGRATAPASSRRGAGSPASRRSCSCAGAGARDDRPDQGHGAARRRLPPRSRTPPRTAPST